MIEVLALITDIARHAWQSIMAIVGAVAMVSILAYLLRGTAGAAIGGSRAVTEALIGAMGIFILILVGVFIVPDLARVGYETAMSAVANPTCGWSTPLLNDLAVMSAGLIGVIGGLRMALALLHASINTAVGGSRAVAAAITDVIGALVGMLLATTAFPIAQYLICR